MSIAALTRRLMELGASSEIIGVVVEFIASADESVTVRVTERRIQNRERQRKRRKLLKTQVTQANDGVSAEAAVIADCHADMPISDSLTLSNRSRSINKEQTQETKKEKKKEDARATRGSRMLPGTAITPEFHQAAVALGANPDRVQTIWDEFVDYWIGVPGARGVKVDWPATWRNRCRNVISRGANGHRANGHRSYPASNGRATGTDAILAGVAAATERRARERGQSAGVSSSAESAGEFDFERH